MNSKILFWMNDDLSGLGLPKILNEKYNLDIYSIFDITDKQKIPEVVNMIAEDKSSNQGRIPFPIFHIKLCKRIPVRIIRIEKTGCHTYKFYHNGHILSNIIFGLDISKRI